MADWDDEDYDVEIQEKPVVGGNDAWSGEDEDEDVKDDWEDDDDDDKPKIAAPEKKKKPLKERIAEREAKRKADLEERKRKEEEARKLMTPEEVNAEKERLRLQEEEEQLMLAKELMGVKVTPSSGIDAMNPQTPEDFQKYSEAIKTKIAGSQSHPLYTKFLEDLFRDLCASLNSEGIKKIGSSLSTLGNEKQKLEKSAVGGGKKKKGKTIKQVRENDFDEGEYDEFDDFM